MKSIRRKPSKSPRLMKANNFPRPLFVAFSWPINSGTCVSHPTKYTAMLTNSRSNVVRPLPAQRVQCRGTCQQWGRGSTVERLHSLVRWQLRCRGRPGLEFAKEAAQRRLDATASLTQEVLPRRLETVQEFVHNDVAILFWNFRRIFTNQIREQARV